MTEYWKNLNWIDRLIERILWFFDTNNNDDIKVVFVLSFLVLLVGNVMIFLNFAHFYNFSFFAIAIVYLMGILFPILYVFVIMCGLLVLFFISYIIEKFKK